MVLGGLRLVSRLRLLLLVLPVLLLTSNVCFRIRVKTGVSSRQCYSRVFTDKRREILSVHESDTSYTTVAGVVEEYEVAVDGSHYPGV